MLGLSVDSPPSLRAFSSGMGGVPHPLIADFHPKGETARAFGAYNETRGFAQRSVFIIDPEGVIRWSALYEPPNLPNPSEILEELRRLKGS